MSKLFNEVFDDCTKYAKKIQTSDFHKKGKYAIVDQGQGFISGYTDNENGLYNKFPAIIFGDHTRIIKYIDFPFFLGADGTKILQPKTNETDCKYLFYFLLNAKIPNTGYNRHYKWLKELNVPIPPLDVQKKIANELDKITDIITKRKVQLEKLDLLVKSRQVGQIVNNNLEVAA